MLSRLWLQLALRTLLACVVLLGLYKKYSCGSSFCLCVVGAFQGKSQVRIGIEALTAGSILLSALRQSLIEQSFIILNACTGLGSAFMSLSILARGERLRERLLAEVADLRITGFQSPAEDERRRFPRSPDGAGTPHVWGVHVRDDSLLGFGVFPVIS